MQCQQTRRNLEVSVDYADSNGVCLGAWLANVRSGAKNNNARTQLTAEQTPRLNELGMNWDGRHNATLDRSYAAVCRYKREHSNLDIPVADTTADGIALADGSGIRKQRG